MLNRYNIIKFLFSSGYKLVIEEDVSGTKLKNDFLCMSLVHCFYQFLLMSSIFTRILSLAHLFYAYFTHGPNKSASAQYDNTRGAWLTQEGCTITERKEGRKCCIFVWAIICECSNICVGGGGECACYNNYFKKAELSMLSLFIYRCLFFR